MIASHKMSTLEELMNIELKKRNFEGYQNLNDFITNDEKSAGFIRAILKDSKFAAGSSDNSSAEIAKTRARHSAITFLMGLVFWTFFEGIIAPSCNRCKNYGQNELAWLWVALYHDVGYFSKHLTDPDFDVASRFKYCLYKDDDFGNLAHFSEEYPCALAYTYDEILKYDKYAKKYHKGDKDERIDHGILGGAIAFDRLMRKITLSGNMHQEILSKYCSLTIAQHNIYKSPSEEKDKEYPLELHSKLSSESPFRIGNGTPLLLFLCLIDTIEAVKRFSKGENSGKYLETLTTLRSIKVEVKKDKLTMDFSELCKRATENSKEIREVFDNYFAALKKLETWTSFHTSSVHSHNLYMLEIVYQKAESSRESIAAMAWKGCKNV